MKPTLRDIARHTGLDVSTVSRVLNNDTSRGISPARREEVLRVARTLGYQPHRSARALRTGRHFNIAYVLGSSGSRNLELPFARARLYGMDEALMERGYLLSLLHFDPASLESLRERVLAPRQVDGLVFNLISPAPEVAEALHAAGIPAVVLDADVFEESGGRLSCVLSDREEGMRRSVGHLAELGHRRIAFVSAEQNTRRLAGYLRALEEHGIPRDDRLIRLFHDPGGSLFPARSAALDIVRSLLREGVPFTAIQAGSDFTAAGALDALREAGIRVPETVALAGFDDVDGLGVSPVGEPFLTTVADPNLEMGRAAAELLLARIEEGAAPRRVILPTRLTVRLSSGTPRPAPGS